MKSLFFIFFLVLGSFVYAQVSSISINENFSSYSEEYKLTEEGLFLKKTKSSQRVVDPSSKTEKIKVGDCFCLSDYIIIKDISHAECPYSSTFCKQVEGESRRLFNGLILNERTKYILPITILIGFIFYYLYKKTGPTKP